MLSIATSTRFALQDTAYIEPGIPHALQLADDLVHGLKLIGTFLAQVTLPYIAEILGDLELNPVGYLLVMLELLEQLVKTVLVIRLVDGLPGISVLLLDYLGEMHDLLLGLLQGKLGSAE